MRIFASEMGKKKNLSGVFCVILIPFVFSHSILNNSSNPFVSRSNYKSTDTSTKLALNLTVYGCIAACKAEFLHPPATVQSLHTPVHHKLWLCATSKYPLSLGGGKKKKRPQSHESLIQLQFLCQSLTSCLISLLLFLQSVKWQLGIHPHLFYTVLEVHGSCSLALTLMKKLSL